MSRSEATTGWRERNDPAIGPSGRDPNGRALGGDFLIERLCCGGEVEVDLGRQLGLAPSVAVRALRPDPTSNPTSLSRFEVGATAVTLTTSQESSQPGASLLDR